MKTGMDPANKYKRFDPGIRLVRNWPTNVTKVPPIWCSVDLRDGNQALAVPMTIEQKLEFFNTLVKCGFKEIEVGFPSASETEFGFVRKLIDENLIPDDVTIQVLVQAREDLIKQTVESLVGAKKVIIHMYNSTSPAQRRIVFGLEKAEVLQMAVQGTMWVKKYAEQLVETDVRFEYSPESFSATETQFALEVCKAVMDVWEPTIEKKIILNLPDTVQMATPNVYADQIEWFRWYLGEYRKYTIISLHAHNDRGTGVAATELGMLAGGDRVEGTLFGNGERTGNADIVTLAFNLFTQGINPELDFSNIDALREVYGRCTGMEVPARQPYSGDLVDTAFSGSHQDAIRKGLRAYAFNFNGAPSCSVLWDVPYLPIDPADKGREYREVIRVNGQSGKGGIAYLLEYVVIKLTKDRFNEFGTIAGKNIDALGNEVKAEDFKAMFWKEYIDKNQPFKLLFFSSMSTKLCVCSYTLMYEDSTFNPQGEGNGPIDAFINSLSKEGIAGVKVFDQSEHALGEGQDAKAIAYIKLQFHDGEIRWGAGVDTSIELASIRAIVSALNRK
ncbi:MAG: 2-isopropylmalate synthase [Candidatus Staskawiczbacteria bacterium]